MSDLIINDFLPLAELLAQLAEEAGTEDLGEHVGEFTGFLAHFDH